MLCLKTELELIPDPDILFEKGTRGGISYISNRYRKDENNLYGYAMSKFVPTNGFKWIDPKELDMNKYSSNSSKGCALEADLAYPKE